jgi:penicillin-binding protein 1C
MKFWLHRSRRRRTRILAVAGMVLLVAGSFGFWLLLPARLFDSPESYVLEARDGTLLGARIASDGQWRFPPASRVPEKFRRAIVVFEDKRFESHSGIDGLAIARALRLDLRAGRVVSGGSTLTMQLARLSRESSERTLGAKLVEALLALRIETAYGKDEILALYAGHAPFGGNVVGLEAAAWRYFGRDPAALSWAEAATLAVLPNNPALVHLKRNRPMLEAKRNLLLHRLRETGDLSDLDLTLALREPLATEPHDLPDLAPHLLDTLRAQNPAQHRIVTTLDARLQAEATAAVRDHSSNLARQNVFNAAAIVIDNRNFEVLAYVGNSSASRDPVRGYSVDIIRRPRSTGSILKPMLFAAMLQDGEITTRMLLPDVPTHYEGFSPENFDHQYRGAVRADEALAHSLNVPAVRMLRSYGVARFADLLRDSGMSTLTRASDDYGLTLILGGAEGNLWDISSMYAGLENIARARFQDATPGFRELKILREAPDVFRGPTPIGTGAAWLTLDTLLEVPRPGEEGHWKNFASSRHIAWKTGTSWGLRDGWSVGNSSRYTVGVWVGNASGEGRPGLTGSTMAAPLMFALFNGLPASPSLDIPTYALQRISVCENDGFLALDGCVAENIWAPIHSHFVELSPHNLLVNLDASGKQRVDSDCESPGGMTQVNWFVLQPGEEFYFRRVHADYRPLPAMRPDCQSAHPGGNPTLALIYPDANARVLIPKELNGVRGRTVFEAVSRRRDATIYWHLDHQYLGQTHTFHQQSLDIAPGEHTLTLVDDAGERVARQFEVLATRGNY